MDIRAWIQGVVAEERHDRLDKLAITGFLHPRDSGRDPLVRCRNLSHSSIGSFLDPINPPSEGSLAKGDNINRPISLQSISLSTLSAIPGASELDGNDKDDKKYTRRLRRKTRPDLYILKPDRKGDDTKWQTNRKRKKKQPDAKLIRKRKKLLPDAARVKDFHAENVSTERLTVSVHDFIFVVRC
jgi:hypothetical protein